MKHEKHSLSHYVAHPQLHSSSEAQHCSFTDLPRTLVSSSLHFFAVNDLTFPTKRVFLTHFTTIDPGDNGVITDGSTGKEADIHFPIEVLTFKTFRQLHFVIIIFF